MATHLFRALSYVITSRQQIYHSSINEEIVNNMRVIEQLLYPHLTSLNDYFCNRRLGNEFCACGADIK